MTPAPIPYTLREQRGWYMYDWANSAFSSTVVTLFFGLYITDLARAAAGPGGMIHWLGLTINPDAYWGYLISLSVFTQVVCLPIAGAIADYSARKRQLLFLFAYIGAATTIAMFFLQGDMWLTGGVLFLVSNLAFGASMVLYNAFLNDVAPESERDAVSAKGWGIGYLGGFTLLALNLLTVFLVKRGTLPISESLAVRISLSSAGVWWAAFTVIPYLTLRQRQPVRPLAPGQHMLASGFRQLWQTLRGLRRYPQTLLFLVAFLVYNDAVQAVISLSGQFGGKHLGIPLLALIGAILMVQFVAFPGALLFNALAKRFTAQRAIEFGLVVWALTMAAMYFVKTATDFYITAFVVALVMGGTQALSRSLFSLMIPQGREAEFFALYETSDKGTSWLAPLIFALTLQQTGSYSNAIASLIVFFVGGLLLLLRVDVRRAAAEAGNDCP